MKLSYLPLAFVTCLSTPLLAQEPPPGEEDKDQLMALLEEQTAIATRTRMNADYVPGMVTVLHGDDLEARGARTVWEALALVPGMETAIEKTGRRRVLVRGLGNTWASGTVKILLNDVSMNSAENGLAEPVFNIPVEQVDRIEVIRGPGSAIYGEFAYMGVINVVTRAEQNRVFAFGGSYNTAGAGAVLNFASPDSPVQASLNLAGWRSSGADVKTGKDLLYAYNAYFPEGAAAVSNAPGHADEDVDAGTAVFKMGYERFSLIGQWSQDGLGDYFGPSSYLPPDPNRIVERTRHRTIDMRQELPITPALTAGIQASWKNVERVIDSGVVFPQSSLGPTRTLDLNHSETTTGLGADFTYRRWAQHVLLAAATTGSVRVEKDSRVQKPVPDRPLPLEGKSREISALTVQDEYRHSDLFTLTTGVRYDEYSDAGVHYSPRIAGVWRLNQQNIVKAQYAEAFRPPTLLEIASADYDSRAHPPAATIRTTELGYIYKGAVTETRVTLFHSRLDDLAVFVQDLSGSGSFATRAATASGTELEQTWRLSPAWTMDGNLSFVDTRDEKTGAAFPGSTKWVANAGTNYRFGAATGTLQAHYISGYVRGPDDPRPNLAGYTTVDLTLSFSHLLTRGMQLRLGIKNLSDARVRYPSQTKAVPADPARPDVITIVPTYPDDYPQAGRNWWAQVGYSF